MQRPRGGLRPRLSDIDEKPAEQGTSFYKQGLYCVPVIYRTFCHDSSGNAETIKTNQILFT